MTSSHFPQRQTADPQALSYASLHSQQQQPGAKSGALCDPFMMQQQLEGFVRDGLLDSAQLLGELLIALAMAPQTNVTVDYALKNKSTSSSSGIESHDGNNNVATYASSSADESDRVRAFHARSYFLFAELLVAKRELKRAIQYYKRYWKLLAGNVNSTAETVELKSKIANCWMQLENPHQAIEILTSIPSQVRTLRVNLILGKLYLHEGLKHKAEEYYAVALRYFIAQCVNCDARVLNALTLISFNRQNPYALEASLALTDLAASKETSTVAFNANSSSSGGGGMDPNASAPRQSEIEKFYENLTAAPNYQVSLVPQIDTAWMQTLVNAHLSAKRGRYRASMDAFESLERVFPNNLHCLLHKGKLEMDQEFYHQAHLNFHRARQVDDQNLAMMDLHADCLRKNSARTQLNTLVHDLFDTSDCHAETWLAAAYYSDMKGEHETALQFCERAIMTDRRHAAAHLFRGSLLLTLHRPEHALVSFTTSCKLTKTLDAYAGMISSYCDLCSKGVNKYKEAVATAKSVVKLFPQKAQSYTLLGSVFALRPENKEHARKAFQRALTLDPRKLAAIFGLVDLLLHEGNFSVAIDRLLVLSEQYAREEVFTKLGDVYTLNKQFTEAMTQYHRSLSLNPVSSEALRGLDRLEKLMRGEDPDELNTTMEHMDPDDQEDSMEAGEYINS